MKRALLVAGMCLLASCTRKNNLLLGRVEAAVGTHRVVVTDCYRTRAPEPQRLQGEAGQEVWRYMPCRDADIWIRGEELTVNGRAYGRIGPADGVLVDHGVVSVQRRGVANAARPQAQVKVNAAKPARPTAAWLAKRSVLKVKHSYRVRVAAQRIKKAGRWCGRFVESMTHPV